MKKGIFVFGLLLASYAGFSQYSLTFCKEVSTEGKADKPSTSVNTNDSEVKILVKSDNKLNATGVEYRIFYVDQNGKETEVSKLPQYTEPEWDFAWKKVTFYNAGTYRVKVYDDKGTYLTSANLSVKTE